MNDFIYTSVADLQKLLMGNSGSQSLAILNNVMAETIGISMHNAVTAQHNAQMLNSATTTSTCARILAMAGASPIPASAQQSPDHQPVEPIQPLQPTLPAAGENS